LRSMERLARSSCSTSAAVSCYCTYPDSSEQIIDLG
jgi:hypothetical protein